MEKGTLYLCATPIGNLDDITVRTLNTLKEADLIACEDTRHSQKLFNHFGISAPTTSYFEHNKREKGEYIISEILKGKNVALVTDAGTPAISDPGEELVRQCIEAGVRVVPVPGAVAFVNALIISGLSTGRFAFEGFLSVNKKSRAEHLESLKHDERTLIFYEAPHKLLKTLTDMRECFGNRKISIIKELTKIHETALYTDLDGAIEYFEENAPRGEFVLVLEGKDKQEAIEEARDEFLNLSVKEHVDMLINSGLTKKDAIKKASDQRGVSKRDVYNEYEKESEK